MVVERKLRRSYGLSWDVSVEMLDRLPEGAPVVIDPHDGFQRIQNVSRFLLKIASLSVPSVCDLR